MNLSKKCSDLSLSPLNIGGGTPDRDLLPLAVLFSVGGVGAVTVAAISSISTWGVAAISSISTWGVAAISSISTWGVAAISSISTWGVAAISSGWVGAVVGYIMCFPLENCGSVSFQCPSW